MALDPRLRPIVRLGRLVDRGGGQSFVERRRRDADMARRGGWLVMRPGPAAVAIEHVWAPVEGGRIRVRLYRPPTPGPHPLHVFLHGGGWCVGGLDERDPRCRTVCEAADCIVASVEYRLAPECQYPTAPEDCYAALCHLVDDAPALGIDPTRVAVGGESAGGNLAAVVCLMARDRSGPALCHQWLDVPATDCTMSQSGHREVPDGYLLDASAIDEFCDAYLPDPASAREPYCSPLLAPSLAGLPPAWVMTAEYDKLRGDGEAYVAALRQAGVGATHIRLRGHIHPSFAFTRLLPSARGYELDAIAALRRGFRRGAGEALSGAG